MKKIAIIGHGYVGKAMHQYFKDHFNVVIYDPPAGTTTTTAEVNECEMAVICVPTPMRNDGSVDTTIVEDIFNWLEVKLVLIKSTVPPGTCKRLSDFYTERLNGGGFNRKFDIVFSPEYIGEGKYNVPTYKGYPHPTDMKQHEFFIFGGDRKNTTRVVSYFMPVSGPDAIYAQTNWQTAELVKYMENSWGAMKVTFCNEFFNVAKTFDVDYNELREFLLLDKRIERMHTVVFPDKRGFGGKCYPKDVNGIVEASTRAGYDPKLLREVLKSNDRIKAV